MPEINLLKNELRERPLVSLGSATTPALYVILAILALEILGYGFLLFYNKQLDRQINQAEQRTAAVNVEVSKVDKDRLAAISFQTRLTNLETLLKNHLFWSAVLGELERTTYKAASYDSLQVSEGENKMTVVGRIPTYTDLGKLMLGLRTSPKILDVVLKNSGQKEAVEGGYSFTLEITFDPKLLLK